MKKIIKENIDWEGKINEEQYSNTLFDQLIVRNTIVKKTIFKKVHFKNCYLGFDSEYIDCIFVQCKFYGKYSSLGPSTEYKNCKFENCRFIGINLFTRLHFYNCSFSGLFKYSILNNCHPNFDKKKPIFKNCDLSELTFNNVSMYGKDIFINCILPKSGIRLFDNDKDKLIKRAEEIYGKIKPDDKIEIETIFQRENHQGQNPIIIDTSFLDSFLRTIEARRIFEKIINGFELENSVVTNSYDD